MSSTKTNRRTFLKHAAMSMAVPTIISSTAMGKGSIPAPSERVNIGVIGIGLRGTPLLHENLYNNNTQVVAISDCFASKRQKGQKIIADYYTKRDGKVKSNVSTAYADFREMLAREDIDGIVVATPDHWHVPLSIYAIEQGKDVYVEKPLGVSVDHAFKLRKLVHDKNAILQYGTQQRSSYYFRFACELARNGYIGDLKTIDAWCPAMKGDGFYVDGYNKHHQITPAKTPPADLGYDRWLGPAPVAPYTDNRVTSFGSWHIYDYALGFVAGWGAHPLDIAQWGNNSDNTAPIHYEGTGTVPKDILFDTIDTWDIRCEYQNGVKMRFMDSFSAKPVASKYYPKMRDHGTTFHGTKGWVSVRRGTIDFSNEKLRRVKLKEDEIHLYESKQHTDNFIDCIKSRKQPISTIDAAVQSDLISHISNAVVRLKRQIQWDPKNECIVNDDQAAKMLNRPLRAPWKV
jgi:predicted dehydrogenase